MIELTPTPIAPLFVSGSQPGRFSKAIERSAGDVIIDLEDAVADSEKAHARTSITAFLSELQPPNVRSFTLSVRINAPSTSYYQDDVAWLKRNAQSVDFVVLPMVEEAHQISELFQELDDAGHSVPILAQIETARGILNATEIASAKGLLTFAFGAADYANELGISTDGEIQFIFARSVLINACAAYKLLAPLDSPYFDLENDDGLTQATNHAKELGFGGKLCIHPKQTSRVAESFLPSETDISQSKAVVSAFEQAQEEGIASVKLDDGTFIDYPVYFRARKLLAKAGSFTS